MEHKIHAIFTRTIDFSARQSSLSVSEAVLWSGEDPCSDQPMPSPGPCPSTRPSEYLFHAQDDLVLSLAGPPCHLPSTGRVTEKAVPLNSSPALGCSALSVGSCVAQGVCQASNGQEGP